MSALRVWEGGNASKDKNRSNNEQSALQRLTAGQHNNVNTNNTQQATYDLASDPSFLALALHHNVGKVLPS